MKWIPRDAIKVEVNELKREVTAYASTFGVVDYQDMRCMPGCFQKSLSERLPEGQIKLFRDHWTHIGVVRHAEEDSTGLLTVSYVSKTTAGNDALEQLLDGSLNRYSFRGTIMRAAPVVEPGTGDTPREILNLTEIKLKEVGPVDLDPANPYAKVLAVKSLDAEALDAIFELPDLLKSFRLGKRLAPDEIRVVKSLLSLYEQIGERVDILESLLVAPDTATSIGRSTPAPSTLASGEVALNAVDLSACIDMVRKMGQAGRPN